MNREEVKKIMRVICASYPNYHPQNMSDVLDAWELLLADFTYEEIQHGLVAYIRNDTSGFAPSIGQIISMISTLKQPEGLDMTPLEAWDLVYKAICDSTYHAQERFAELPPVIQKAVGAPGQLKSWAMDESFTMGVAQSQFIRVYNQVLEREKQISKMPQNIRPESVLECKQTTIAIEDKEARPWYEGDNPPDDLAERINQSIQNRRP